MYVYRHTHTHTHTHNMGAGMQDYMELDPNEAIEDPTDIMARVIAAAEVRVGRHSRRVQAYTLGVFKRAL